MKLLIPILTDALVVDDVLNANEMELWARNADDYKWTLRYQKANPNPLQRTGKAPTGVHLQWLLPEVLCHGEHDNGDTIEFPKVPNRWLVNRIYLNTNNELTIKSWVILSDFIQENPNGKANYIYEKNGELVKAKLGKVVDLANFKEVENDELFLTVIGAGNAAFSTFTSENENVFSFIDKLEGLENETLELTYQITGWYSNTSEAPSLEELKFEKPDNFEGEAFLCHGSVYDIFWYGKAGDTDLSISGKPKVDNDIIVANSSFDAIVRLVQKQMMEEQKLELAATQQTAQLLAAFEHHILDKIDKTGGLLELEKKTLESWFTAENGGTIWTIQANKTEKGLEKKLKSKGVIRLLNQLNEAQVDLDKQLNTKDSKQTELYTYWIKSNRNNLNSSLKESNQIQYETLLGDFQLFELNLAKAKIKQEKLLSDLNKLLKKSFKNKTVLKQTMQPKFWEANEPVILIHAAKASDKYGFDKQLKLEYQAKRLRV